MSLFKIKRDAFLYLEPKYVNREDFAQCGTCAMWNRDNHLCLIMDMGVEAGDSCNFYMQGQQFDEMAINLVDPDEAGYVEREVRCENCQYGGERCGLYLQLNSMFPDLFDLDPRISPYGCCNANTPKDPT